MRWTCIATILLFNTGSAFGGQCDVPGARNPNVTQENIQSTICVKGWTKTIRPSRDYTMALKRQLLPAGAETYQYELDHCIPLELGGHPTDHSNLWLEEWGGRCGARVKDHTENFLRSLVCSGLITLAEAQERVMNWCKGEER